MIFDTHAHYIDSRFDEDRNTLLSSMKDNNVGLIMEVSARLSEVNQTLDLANEYDFIYASLGVHPDEVLELENQGLDLIERLSSNAKVKAVGEIGLDYYGEDSVDKTTQEKWFRNQIALARNINKPIVVHSRDAADDTYQIMKSEHCENIGGVVHCFSYSPEMAMRYIDMGFYIGIGGVLTFKNGKKLKDVVKEIPLDRIVLETDCPYLAPTPHRGERNDSSMIKFVVSEIAALKNISEEEVEKVTFDNGIKMYRI